MIVNKILVTIESEDEIDLDEYKVAIEDACAEVESRPMISGAVKITVKEVA